MCKISAKKAVTKFEKEIKMAFPNHYIDQKERELIFKLQNLAIDMYGSIRGLARACHMNREIMDRVQMH